MTQKELEQKVIDAEGRVAKREAVLKKHNSQLAKMIEKGADRFDISIKREDIKSATSKLAEARETLANWRDKLNTRITRDAYLEANTPEILKDFLENWKQHAIGYYREKRIRFIEYREGLKAKERAARLEALQTLPSLEKYRELYKGRELTDYDLANLWPRRDVDAFLSERGLEYHQIQKKLREAGDQITLRLLEIHDEDEREAWLEKTMDEEKRAKLLDLISRIMSTVGTITDAAALYIGPEGDIWRSVLGQRLPRQRRPAPRLLSGLRSPDLHRGRRSHRRRHAGARRRDHHGAGRAVRRHLRHRGSTDHGPLVYARHPESYPREGGPA